MTQLPGTTSLSDYVGVVALGGQLVTYHDFVIAQNQSDPMYNDPFYAALRLTALSVSPGGQST
jgi:hypothetical protein